MEIYKVMADESGLSDDIRSILSVVIYVFLASGAGTVLMGIIGAFKKYKGLNLQYPIAERLEHIRTFLLLIAAYIGIIFIFNKFFSFAKGHQNAVGLMTIILIVFCLFTLPYVIFTEFNIEVNKRARDLQEKQSENKRHSAKD